MKYEAAWKKKRREDAVKIAELRDAVATSSEELRAIALSKDEAVMSHTRGWLEQYPDHSNVPLWEAVLAKGCWGHVEWAAASARTKAIHDARQKQETESSTAQGELF